MSSYKRLYHISDIHIRQHQRHGEYREVFSNFCNMLRQDKAGKDSILVCTGDVLHSKTQLTPECIELTREFFREVSSILPTVVIAGNHDANLSNLTRQDALSPILEPIMADKKGKNLHYFKNTGVYTMKNLSFAVISVFDETFPPIKEHPKNTLKVALYHGTLDGAKTDQDYKLQSSMKQSAFSAYDLTLLGDIHRHQFLSPRMEYAGSMIQQNFGETLDLHGYVLWDLVDMQSQFIEVPNQYGFATFLLRNNKLQRPSQVPKKCNARLLHDSSDPNVVAKTARNLENEFGGNVVVAQTKTSKNGQIQADTDQEDIDNNKIDFDTLITAICDKNNIPDQIIDAVLDKHHEMFVLKHIDQASAWQLVKLEFSNLFCYGSKNSINFEKCRDIMGLLAPNHTGKSALLDVILFALFDKCSRGRTVSDYLNRKSERFSCTITFRIGDQLFRIEKIGHAKESKVAKDPLYRKIEVKMTFSARHPHGWVSMNEPTMVQTKKKITELIGDFNDFLLTSVTLQDQGLGMLTMTQTERKTLITKLFRLDIFDELHKTVKKQISKNKASIEELKRLGNESSTDIDARLDELTQKWQQLDMDREVSEAQVESFPEQIIKLHAAVQTVENIHHNVDMEMEQELLHERLTVLELPDKKLDNLQKEKEKLTVQIIPREKPLVCVTDKLKKQQLELKNTKEGLKSNKKAIVTARKENKNLLKLKETMQSRQTVLIEQRAIMSQINETEHSLQNLGKFKVNNKCSSCQANMKVFEPEKEKLLQAIPKLQDALNKTVKKGSKKSDLNLEDISLELSATEGSIADISKKLRGLNIDMLEKVQTTLSNEIEILTANVAELKVKDKEYSKQKKIEDVQNKLRDRLNVINDNLATITEYDEINNRLQLFKKYGTTIRKNKEISAKISNIENKYRIAKDEHAILRQQTTSTSHQVELLKVKLKERREVEQRIETLQSDNTVLAALEKCYHINGIPCTMMEKYIPQVQDEVNRILTRIAPFSVEISVQNQSVELYKIPNHGGGKVHLECTSGYEKFVASLALRIAFRNFSLIGQPNFMILDEGFSSADSTNVVGFAPLFNYLREQFQFVIMVSHLNELKQEADHMITLETTGSTTRVVY